MPECRRHHRRRRFRVRPEALGDCYENYDAMPILHHASSIASAAPVTLPESERHSEPQAKFVPAGDAARRRARKGMRICLEVLLLALVCTHFREIWKVCLSAVLAWPTWVHDWATASLLPH